MGVLHRPETTTLVLGAEPDVPLSTQYNTNSNNSCNLIEQYSMVGSIPNLEPLAVGSIGQLHNL